MQADHTHAGPNKIHIKMFALLTGSSWKAKATSFLSWDSLPPQVVAYKSRHQRKKEKDLFSDEINSSILWSQHMSQTGSSALREIGQN